MQSSPVLKFGRACNAALLASESAAFPNNNSMLQPDIQSFAVLFASYFNLLTSFYHWRLMKKRNLDFGKSWRLVTDWSCDYWSLFVDRIFDRNCMAIRLLFDFIPRHFDPRKNHQIQPQPPLFFCALPSCAPSLPLEGCYATLYTSVILFDIHQNTSSDIFGVVWLKHKIRFL